MLIHFEGLAGPVALIGCDDLADGIAALLRGWRFETSSGGPPPIITIRGTQAGYGLESVWRTSALVHDDRTDAICSFIVDLIKAYIANDTSLLCLHCAAVELAGRLVVFPSRYQAGKSTLSIYLAAAGVRVFADDVLPIDKGRGTGVAPGVLPRLRLPLPDDADHEFRDFVRQRAGPASKRHLYLDLDAEELAPRGDQAPIGGFVLLHRRPGGRAELTPMPKSEMLKRVILRNFASDVPVNDILDRLYDVVAGAQCFRLRYGDGAEAAALLKETFQRWPSPARTKARVGSVGPAAIAASHGAASHGAGSARGRIRRNSAIIATPVEDELFLVNPAGEAIFHLNVVGAALWRLLAEPATPDEAVGLLREAFPRISVGQIERDVRALLSDLAARGLVEASP